MALTITIETRGAAFGEAAGGGDRETADLIRKVAGMVADGRTEGQIIDSWGNTCGSWTYTNEALETERRVAEAEAEAEAEADDEDDEDPED